MDGALHRRILAYTGFLFRDSKFPRIADPAKTPSKANLEPESRSGAATKETSARQLRGGNGLSEQNSENTSKVVSESISESKGGSQPKAEKKKTAKRAFQSRVGGPRKAVPAPPWGQRGPFEQGPARAKGSRVSGTSPKSERSSRCASEGL